MVWEVVRNYDQFVDIITEHGVPKYVTFDHDLADAHYEAMWNAVHNKPHDYGTEKTGYDCAKWLVDYCDVNKIKFPEYQVHSMNPIGSHNIRTYIENAKKHLEI